MNLDGESATKGGLFGISLVARMSIANSWPVNMTGSEMMVQSAQADPM